MSNKISEQDKMGIEDKQNVVISPEDCQECAKFFEFFEIPVPPELKAAFDNFIAAPTVINQNELKFQLADVITNSQHPVFMDDVFSQVKPETRECRDELAFEREFEKTLSSAE